MDQPEGRTVSSRSPKACATCFATVTAARQHLQRFLIFRRNANP